MVATLSGKTLTAHDAATGKMLWTKAVTDSVAEGNGRGVSDTPAGTVRLADSLPDGDVLAS